MRILFFGDGPWAQIALKKIKEFNEIDVLGVVLRYDTQDYVLRSIAEGYNIPVYANENINSREFIQFVKDLNLDLSVSMSFNQIIKKELRNVIKNGFINCHAGKLPNYRGRNILNWALINNEKEIGITAHFIDDGIDTGDIISQTIMPIEKEDDYSTLLNKAINKCPEVLLDAIIKIKENRVSTIKQSHINGSYFSYRRNGDEFIDWNWSSIRIYNFIRAIVRPAPGAQTYLEGKKIFIWESELVDFPGYISTEGEIIRKENDGVIVKTGDNALKIKWVSDATDGEMYVPNYSVGKRFGINMHLKIMELENEIKSLKIRLDSCSK